MKKDGVALVCDIGELAGLFQNSTDVRNFLQQVVEMVCTHMSADVSSVFLCDPQNDTLTLRATKGLNPESIDRLTLAPGEGIVGTAMKELRSILENEGKASPYFKAVPGIGEESYAAFLAVPIVRGLERIGVLTAQHHRPGFFDDRDLKALKAIAAQLAATLENAKLLMELQTQQDAAAQAQPVHAAPIARPKGLWRGRAAAEGLGLGRAVLLGAGDEEVFLSGPAEGAYRATLGDFRHALAQSEAQLEELQAFMESQFSDVASLIFSTHLLMLRDIGFSGAMIEAIEAGASPARAIVQVVNRYVHIFSVSPNARLQEKVQDVKDLGHRLLRNLSTEAHEEGDYQGQIVVSPELLPSQLIKIAGQKAEGLLLQGAGASAHIGILARSLGIPVIFTDAPEFGQLAEGQFLILDGDQGTVHIDPPEASVQEFLALKSARDETARLAALALDDTKTTDGVSVQVLANINLLSDIPLAKRLKAQGVGLYRSEVPFIIRNDFPTEEEQFRVYRKLLSEMEGREVVLRTLDIGGDKVLSYLPQGAENNPFLGLRALRFSLKNKDIFHDQIRALLRAGEGYTLKVMFPLVSSLDDFLEAKEEVKACLDQLAAEGVPHNTAPELGAMIELPSAVEVANELAKEADFLCVGTNDLVQYILGVDRTNEAVSNLYQAKHPAVLRALQRLARAAANHSCPLSICGEVAADPVLIPFLIGVGFRKLSVNPKLLPQVQQTVVKLNYRECQVAAEKAANQGTLKELHAHLDGFARRYGLT